MTNTLEAIRNDVKNWWWFLITGILFIAAGIAIYMKPAEGYVSLSILFSLVMIGSGLAHIIFSASNSGVLKGWGWILVSGIIDLALGTYLFLYPLVTMATLPFFVGFWMAFRAFYLMGASFDLQALKVPGWGWLLFGGIVLLILSFFIIWYPAAGVISIIAISGWAFIVAGILSIYLSFQLKNVKKEAGKVKGEIEKIKEEYKHA